MTIIARVIDTESLLKAKIINPDGTEVGQVENLLLDASTGQTEFVLISPDEFSRKLIPVPWIVMEYNAETNQFVLDIDKNIFASAEGIDPLHMPKNVDLEWLQQKYELYAKSDTKYS